MIALINYLGQVKRPHLQLTLICAGEIEGGDKLYGLGQLNPDQFQLLFKNRLKLGTREIGMPMRCIMPTQIMMQKACIIMYLCRSMSSNI